MGAADAHDAGSPGGSRPKQGQLMLIAPGGFKATVGAADAHDVGSHEDSRRGQLMLMMRDRQGVQGQSRGS